MLLVDSLAVGYKDASGRLFDAVSLDRHEFKEGTLTAVSGPSGCGKTSFLHALAGLLKPSRGSISWNGENISRLSEGQRDGWRRRNVGYVFQDFQLIAELSPYANASLPGTFSRDKAPAGHVRGLLQEFGVPIDRSRASLLSRGEQQRVAFARALYFDPPVILADEPTASLDAENGALVVARLLALAKSGKTVIAVSHDADLIAACDTDLQFSRGKLVAEIDK